MMQRRRFPAALIGLSLAGGAHAQGLVILTRGAASAAHPIGSTLAPGTMLMAGDRIDVLERGGTRQLIGPTRYVPVTRSTAGENARLVVTQLLDRRRIALASGAVMPLRRDVRTRGLTHAPGDDLRKYGDTLWMVDGTISGTTCFRTGEAPWLWHRPARADSRTMLTDPVGTATPVAWPAFQAVAQWPSPPPAAAAAYRLGQADGTTATVRLVPVPDPATIDDLVVSLDAAGCTPQLSYLLDQIAANPAD